MWQQHQSFVNLLWQKSNSFLQFWREAFEQSILKGAFFWSLLLSWWVSCLSSSTYVKCLWQKNNLTEKKNHLSEKRSFFPITVWFSTPHSRLLTSRVYLGDSASPCYVFLCSWKKITIRLKGMAGSACPCSTLFVHQMY